MKKHKLLSILLLFFACNNLFSQANTTLSNLVSPTNINQSLTPSGNNTLSLGSTARSWRFLYLDSQVYMKDLLTIHLRGTGNFFAGQSSGNLTFTGIYNTGVGYLSLGKLTNGGSNAALGVAALSENTSGTYNVAMGVRSLNGNTSGRNNTGVGYRTLFANTTGNNSVGIGDSALFANTTGNSNTGIGYIANVGSSNLTNATAIGANAFVNTSNSVVLGSVSGVNRATVTANVGIGTNSPTSRLHIVGNQLLDGNLTFGTGAESIQFATPGSAPAPMMYMFPSGTVNTDRMVIAHSPSYPNWGLRYSDLSDDFDFLGNGISVMRIDLSSQYVGIGTTSPAYKLDVCGTIRAKEVRVETGWCDYVFEKDYKLRSIDDLEKYVNEKKHLPGIAPASEVEKDGLKVAEMNKAMMEKIEELSLYVIQLNKENKKLQAEVEELKKK